MGWQKVLASNIPEKKAKNDQIVFKDQSGTPIVPFSIGHFDVFSIIGLSGRHKP